jgi:integrase
MRTIHRLKARQVINAKPKRGKFVSRLADGAGLYLQITRSKEGFNRNWIFRFERNDERHDLGLGPVHTISLAEARDKARLLRQQLLDNINPLEAKREEELKRQRERDAGKAEEAKRITFRQCAAMYIEQHGDTWKNAKHAAQWPSSLETYAYPVIGDLAVGDVDESHLIRILQPIWKTKTETAKRVRSRIELVLGYAIARRFRVGDNPARWRGHLKTLLGALRNGNGHHAALPFDEAPAFMQELRARQSTSALALQFLILTAARTNEVINAEWSSEINLKDKTWTIPAERMKARKKHRVPLSDPAVEILSALPDRSRFVFAGSNGKALSNMALLELLRGMRRGITVHGFRSTFRDWAAEKTSAANHIVEMALAHSIGDKTEKAYRRGDLFVRRTRLMDQWAKFLAKPRPKSGEVADLDAERERRANA